MKEIDPKVNAWFVRVKAAEAWRRWREEGFVGLPALGEEGARRLAEDLGEDSARWEAWKFKSRAKGRLAAAVAKFSGREDLHPLSVRKGDVVVVKLGKGGFALGEVADGHARVVDGLLRRAVLWKEGLYALDELVEGRESLKKKFKAPGPLVRVSEFLLTDLARRLFPRQAREYRKFVHPTVEEVLEFLGFTQVDYLFRLEAFFFEFARFRSGGDVYSVLVHYEKGFWSLVKLDPYTGEPRLLRKEFYRKPTPEELLAKDDLTLDELLKYF